MNVNKTKISSLFGVSINTVDNWLKKGMPFIAKPDGYRIHEWKISISAAIAWREKRIQEIYSSSKIADNIDDARLRKLNAEAEMLEIDLAKKKAALIPTDEVERGMHEMCSNLRNRLLAIPTKIAPKLGKKGHKLVEAEIYEALEELSG